MASDLEGFVDADGRADLVKEARRRIDAEGVTYVYYQFASVTGRIMGKGVPAPHWETIAQKGFHDTVHAFNLSGYGNVVVDGKGIVRGVNAHGKELERLVEEIMGATKEKPQK